MLVAIGRRLRFIAIMCYHVGRSLTVLLHLVNNAYIIIVVSIDQSYMANHLAQLPDTKIDHKMCTHWLLPEAICAIS